MTRVRWLLGSFVVALIAGALGTGTASARPAYKECPETRGCFKENREQEELEAAKERHDETKEADKEKYEEDVERIHEKYGKCGPIKKMASHSPHANSRRIRQKRTKNYSRPRKSTRSG